MCDMTFLGAMPEEILAMISSYLILPDLGYFRATSKVLERACERRLWAHMHAKSLLNFVATGPKRHEEFLLQLLHVVMTIKEAAAYVKHLEVKVRQDAARFAGAMTDYPYLTCSLKERASVRAAYKASSWFPKDHLEKHKIPESFFHSIESLPEVDSSEVAVCFLTSLTLPLLYNLRTLVVCDKSEDYTQNHIHRRLVSTFKSLTQAAMRPRTHSPRTDSPLSNLTKFIFSGPDFTIAAPFLALPNLQEAELGGFVTVKWPDDQPKSNIHTLICSGLPAIPISTAFNLAAGLRGPCMVSNTTQRRFFDHENDWESLDIPHAEAVKKEWIRE